MRYFLLLCIAFVIGCATSHCQKDSSNFPKLYEVNYEKNLAIHKNELFFNS